MMKEELRITTRFECSVCAQSCAKSSADTISVNRKRQNEVVSITVQILQMMTSCLRETHPVKLVVEPGTKAGVSDPKAHRLCFNSTKVLEIHFLLLKARGSHSTGAWWTSW